MKGVQLLLSGCNMSQAAKALGVTRASTGRWNKALKLEGVQSLAMRKACGRPSRFSALEEIQIREIFLNGPKHYGSLKERWSNERMAAQVHITIGIQYSGDHMGRLLDRLGLKKQRKRESVPPRGPAYAGSSEGILPQEGRHGSSYNDPPVGL